MPKVNFTRTEVVDLKPRWKKIRDCIAGSDSVKKARTDYLPMPNAADLSAENKARYEAYLTRALFYGVTGRTRRGLVGQVFKRPPVANVPPQLDILKVDADGSGLGLEQLARKTLETTVPYGRAGILVDYPKVPEGQVTTVKDQNDGRFRPTILRYDPWDIINWRTITRGSEKVYSLIVLCESEVTDDDGFEQEHEEYYRVLRLVDNVYHSQVWYFDKEKNDFVMESEVIPTMGNGQPWPIIPFTFIGSDNNDEIPDLPPLYDLAEINLAHYRNSADYEEAVFITGQPTPVFTGLTQDWVSKVFKKGVIELGSRAAVPLPQGGAAMLLQAQPNTMCKEAMDAKERQMVAIGAKLVEQQQVQRTATEVGMEEASTSSLLATAATNVSHAFTLALGWAAVFASITDLETVKSGKAEEISYELNIDFELHHLAPQEVQQVVAAWQAGALVDEEMRDKLRNGGWAYLDDEEWKDQKEAADMALGLPAGSPPGAPAAGGFPPKPQAPGQKPAPGAGFPPKG